MNLKTWLDEATQQLKQAGIGSARLDALVLAEDTIGKDRAWILAHPEFKIPPDRARKLNRQIARRQKHEPLAYVRGFTEFYGRKFLVNKHVLEPRPESETMIDLLLKLGLKNPVIADVGSGSGALGISAKLEISSSQVDLYDIDSYCLAVARHNAHLHELSLHAYKRDLLNRPVRAYIAVLANLPYVPMHWRVNEAALHEPKLAIYGGKDGLDVYRRFFEQLAKMAKPPAYVLTESMPPQHQKLAQIAGVSGYRLKMSQDFIQVFQCV